MVHAERRNFVAHGCVLVYCPMIIQFQKKKKDFKHLGKYPFQIRLTAKFLQNFFFFPKTENFALALRLL